LQPVDRIAGKGYSQRLARNDGRGGTEDRRARRGVRSRHERAQRAIAALERIGEGLRRDVEAAAREAVTKALAEVHQKAQHAAGALQELQGFSFGQSAWQHRIAVPEMAVTVACVWWSVPSMRQLTALRAQQSKLQPSIEDLNQRGGRVKLSTCGPEDLSVLVDEAAGTFGAAKRGEAYMIAKGY